jgi:diadenosine tetraphosphate (Ap4A) HIT family hydrolase
MTNCPFCKPNWPNLNHAGEPIPGILIVHPLNPVTLGHVLVIHQEHTVDAAANGAIAGQLIYQAAEWVRRKGIQANIITSIGPDATQTVRHTHVHVVPRRPNDGLTLPWTGQEEHRDKPDDLLHSYRELRGELCTGC